MSNRNSEMQVVSAVEQFGCSGTVQFCGLGCQGCLRPLNRVVSWLRIQSLYLLFEGVGETKSAQEVVGETVVSGFAEGCKSAPKVSDVGSSEGRSFSVGGCGVGERTTTADLG